MPDLTLEEERDLARTLGATYLRGHEDERIVTLVLIHTEDRTHVVVELENGAKGVAFSYDADELTPMAYHFVGLQLGLARKVFYEADTGGHT